MNSLTKVMECRGEGVSQQNVLSIEYEQHVAGPFASGKSGGGGEELWRDQNTRLEPGPLLGVGVGRGRETLESSSHRTI